MICPRNGRPPSARRGTSTAIYTRLIDGRGTAYEVPRTAGVLPEVTEHAFRSGGARCIDSLTTEEPEISGSVGPGSTAPASSRKAWRAVGARNVLMLGDRKEAAHWRLEQLTLTVIVDLLAFPKVVEDSRQGVGRGVPRQLESLSPEEPKIA